MEKQKESWLLTSFFMVCKVHCSIAATSQLFFEVVPIINNYKLILKLLVFDVALARVNEPLSLNGYRLCRLALYHILYALTFIIHN